MNLSTILIQFYEYCFIFFHYYGFFISLIFISSWVLTNFWKTGNDERPFSCLVSVALSLPSTLEKKSDALGIKSLILRVHLAIQRSSENIDP